MGSVFLTGGKSKKKKKKASPKKKRGISDNQRGRQAMGGTSEVTTLGGPSDSRMWQQGTAKEKKKGLLKWEVIREKNEGGRVAGSSVNHRHREPKGTAGGREVNQGALRAEERPGSGEIKELDILEKKPDRGRGSQTQR